MIRAHGRLLPDARASFAAAILATGVAYAAGARWIAARRGAGGLQGPGDQGLHGADVERRGLGDVGRGGAAAAARGRSSGRLISCGASASCTCQ